MEDALFIKVTTMAQHMRRRALDMALIAGGGGVHLGPALSMIDILATLYGSVMKFDVNNPESETRDRFILSKGHGGLGLYTVLTEVGFMTSEDANSFQQNGSAFTTHPIINRQKGIEFSNGSLGMGLGLGIGVALALKKKNLSSRVFIMLGDGECNEGSVWEGVLAAPHFKLDNLTVVIDRNGLQQSGLTSELMDTKDMAEKWRAFGWDALDVDGHDVQKLYDSFTSPMIPHTPRAIIAHTIKGKGYAFCENNPSWHHGVLTKTQYETAIAESEGK